MIVKYSKEYPYLPEAVGDSCHDLGRLLGISASAVSHALHRGSKIYVMVPDDEDIFPDADGGLWYYDKNGNVVRV